MSVEKTLFALLAQSDRVFGYEPKGQEFESLAARHTAILVISRVAAFLYPEIIFLL